MSNEAAVYWDQKKDEHLIALVRYMPELYDVNSPKFNNTIAKNNAWQTVGANLKIPAYKCVERWEYLLFVQRRDQPNSQTGASSSELNETKKNSNNGEEQTAKTRDTAVVNREPELPEVADLLATKPKDLLSPPNVIFQPSLPSKASTSETPPAPLIDRGNGENIPPHSIDVFFLCMANTVKSFNAIDQLRIKCKLFDWVRELEARYISNQNYVPANHFMPTLLMPPLPIHFPQALPNPRGYEEPNPANYYHNPPN